MNNLLYIIDILYEKNSDLSLLFSIMLFIIDELVKGINLTGSSRSSQNEIYFILHLFLSSYI